MYSALPAGISRHPTKFEILSRRNNGGHYGQQKKPLSHKLAYAQIPLDINCGSPPNRRTTDTV